MKTNKTKTCATCNYLVISEGEPYYCAILPLYTDRNKSDIACEQYNDK